MNEPLFSPSWYRVQAIKPRIRAHAQIHRHVYRDQPWFVLQDRASGKFHRFSPASYAVVGLMDGARSVHEVWELANERLGDEAPTQDEMIQLLAQLHGADVLQCDVSPDSLELLRRHDKRQRQNLRQRLWSPLAVRFPLVDPDRFLDRWLWLVRPLFTRTGLVAWLLLILLGLVLTGMHWSEISEGGIGRILTPYNLLILWLTYPVVKALHELGHGFATKVWGGEVHEMGIMLLVLMPIPYVDASAASAFAQRRHRVLVGAAGIMLELALACAALLVWLNVSPGIVSAVAFNVMLIGGVSTVLFNGNPLLRFDGYYILADAIEIPNLGTRANKYLGFLVQRYIFGLTTAHSPAVAAGERGWLAFFGVASFVYRIGIILVIALYLAEEYLAIGVALALWALVTQVLVPLGKGIRFISTSPQLRRTRARAVSSTAVVLGLLVAFLVGMPVPSWSSAQGVVWLPQRSHVRVLTTGFVERVLVESGRGVAAGDPLIRCEDPILEARVRALAARLDELRVRYNEQWVTNRVQAEITGEEMATISADLERTRERLAALVIRAPIAGRLVVPGAQHLPGRYLRQGQVVAYVLDSAGLTARVVVSQDSIGMVRERTRAVEVRLADRIAEVVPAAIRREVPAARNQLPNPALGTSGGGPIAVDPVDEHGLTPFEKVFQLELALFPRDPITHFGGRLYVRFDHGQEPLAAQWYRMARQLFLRRLSV